MRTLDGKKWKKTPHPINPQCLTSIYSYVGAHMMHYDKNDSQIKILIIPKVLAYISKTSILDHTDNIVHSVIVYILQKYQFWLKLHSIIPILVYLHAKITILEQLKFLSILCKLSVHFTNI